MKKRPIYLYVLLTVSAILSSFTFIGTFFGSEKVTEKSLVFLHNGPHKLLTILSILLLIAAVVFIVKKNILYANFAYIAYVL